MYSHYAAKASRADRRPHRWIPSLAFWGVGAGGAATLFLSGVPLFQEDVLKKFPILRCV